jgi:hypothetical protein
MLETTSPVRCNVTVGLAQDAAAAGRGSADFAEAAAGAGRGGAPFALSEAKMDSCEGEFVAMSGTNVSGIVNLYIFKIWLRGRST